MKKAKQCKLDLAKIKMCITHSNESQATDNYSPEICPHYNTDVRKVSEKKIQVHVEDLTTQL